MNVLNATEVYTLKLLILCCMKFTSKKSFEIKKEELRWL